MGGGEGGVRRLGREGAADAVDFRERFLARTWCSFVLSRGYLRKYLRKTDILSSTT